MTTLRINKITHEIEAEEDTSLLWVIRDIAGLTGTKYGCGKGLCGACTVHIDGQAVRSCITPLGFAKGKSITTIEGLVNEPGNGLKLHPLQQAWIEEQVPQCGYCQSGQIMAAAAFLKENPNPSDATIKENMRNLCRCGTYTQIFRAIKKVSQSVS